MATQHEKTGLFQMQADETIRLPIFSAVDIFCPELTTQKYGILLKRDRNRDLL
jgi:hypothetical protein